MKRLLAIALGVLAIILLVWRLSGPSAIASEIQGQSWTLVRLTVDGEDVPLPHDASVTLRHMEKKRYVGTSGVNHYGIRLDINRHGEITFLGGGDGVTEMAGPPHLMAIEEACLAAFWQIKTAKVSGSTLVLEGPKVRLEYKGEPVAPIDRSGSPEDPVSITLPENE